MSPDREPSRVAVLMSRFPKLSETFILEEVLELARSGVAVEVFPLLRERDAVVHPRAARLDRRVHHLRLVSPEVFGAQLWWLRREPRRYLSVWRRGLAANRRPRGFLRRSLYVIPKAAAFARRMEALQVGHIHAHYATHPALAAWVASQLTGIEYSFTVHAHDLYVERPMLAEKIEGARFVRTISDYNRALLHRLYGERAAAKTFVIRCGVDPLRFGPRPGANGRAGRPFTLICVASLEEYKGHRYLLDALARLRAAGVDARCLLVGDGELRTMLECRRDQLGLRRHVTFCGPQPADHVRELLDRADAAVLPSVVTSTGKMEGIPVALMEAMAVGLPVVATNISGVGELIKDGHTGLLVPQRDPPALAEAIARLARNPELRQTLVARGRERVRHDFDLRRNVDRLHALLEDGAPSAAEPRQPAAGAVGGTA